MYKNYTSAVACTLLIDSYTNDFPATTGDACRVMWKRFHLLPLEASLEMLSHTIDIVRRLEACGAFAAHKLRSICCGEDSAVVRVGLRRTRHNRQPQFAVVVYNTVEQLQKLFNHVLGQWLVWAQTVYISDTISVASNRYPMPLCMKNHDSVARYGVETGLRLRQYCGL